MQDDVPPPRGRPDGRPADLAVDRSNDRSTEPARGRIEAGDPQAVAAWATRLGFSAEEVLDAVRAVGDVAKDVEQYLRGGGKRTA